MEPSDSSAADLACEACDEEDEDEGDAPTCPICLNPFASQEAHANREVGLGCAHSVCAECLHRFAEGKLKARPEPVAVRCPMCAVPVAFERLWPVLNGKRPRRTLGVRADGAPDLFELVLRLQRAALDAPARDPSVEEGRAEPEDEQDRARAQRLRQSSAATAALAFEGWARRNHVKLCGSCAAPIQKTGGCTQMRCSNPQCLARFRWDQTPLAYPCKGYHRCATPPFVYRCPHLRDDDFAARHRWAYHGQRTLVMLPVYAVAVPLALAVGPPVLLASAAKSAWRKRRERLRRLRRERWRVSDAYRQRAAAQNEAERRRMTACRQSGNHEWVHGWCHRCGALEAAAPPHASAAARGAVSVSVSVA